MVLLGGFMKLKKLAALVLAGALCLSAFTGCATDTNKAIATLGEETIPVSIANFICKYQKVMMDDMYSSYFGENMWSSDLSGSGVTMEEEVKDSVMESLHELYTVKAHMADYNVELTEEEQQKIKEAAVAFIEANTPEALEEMSATEEVVEELLSLYTIQWKVYEKIIAEADVTVTDEEANMRGYTLISVGIAGEYDDEGNYTEYTEDKVKAIKEEVEKAQLALIDTDLEAIAEEYDYNIQTGAYAKEDATLELELLKAMDALKEGETSDVIETESALYLVRIDTDCDEEATEQNRKSLISEREYAFYEEILTGWQKDDGWKVDEKVLDAIDFHHILTQQSETQKDNTNTQEATETQEESTSTQETTETEEDSTSTQEVTETEEDSTSTQETTETEEDSTSTQEAETTENK